MARLWGTKPIDDRGTLRSKEVQEGQEKPYNPEKNDAGGEKRAMTINRSRKNSTRMGSATQGPEKKTET